MNRMRSQLITFAAMTLAIFGPVIAQENPSGQITAVENLVAYYSVAYSQGQDRIPRTPSPLATDLVRKDLALETIRPQSALTGNAFVAEDGMIVKLVGAQGCLSTQLLTSNTSCTRLSILGMSSALGVAIQGAKDAFPCHVFAKSTTPSPIKFAECFFEKSNGEVASLSGYLVLAGTAFAARDGAGKPLFADNASFEAAAKQARSGIWSDNLFTHPYGERYRNNPINP